MPSRALITAFVMTALTLPLLAPAAGGAELTAWNIDLVETEPMSLPDEAVAELDPVRIVAARNGLFSGKVMLAGEQLEHLRAMAGDLHHADDGAAIDADAVTLRYSKQWRDMSSWYRPHGQDMLRDEPVAGQDTTALWITVAVPADAAPGLYRGQVIVSHRGTQLEVDVELEVSDWTLPEPRHYTTYIDMVQVPDTLSMEYDLELWSDEHWELIGRSMAHMAKLGNRTVYLPLIAQTNLGNEQSLVRWVPAGDGSFTFDLSRLERYLDLAREKMGEPEHIVLNVWEVYQEPAENKWDDEWWEGLSEQQRDNSYFRGLYERGQALREHQAEAGLGPLVSMLDGGEVTTVPLPAYTDPIDAEPWHALFAQLRSLLAERGLEDRMVLGMLTDSWPDEDEVRAMHEISGGLDWVSHAHWSAVQRRGGSVRGVTGIAFESMVWDVEYADPDEPRRYGWQRDEIVLAHYRMRGYNGFYPSRMRTVVESNLTGDQRGLGRVGADTWWALRDRRGNRRGTAAERYPESLWRNLDVRASLLGPGPDGPVPTARLMHLREGLQEAEARLFIEQALLQRGTSLDAQLVERAEAILDARHRAAWAENGQDEAVLEELGIAEQRGHQQASHLNVWFVASGWQQRTQELYDVAGEIASALGQARAR